MVRIVGGEFRGRPLSAPEGARTRPTSDRAREAIFNILEHAPWARRLQDLRVIDLFAGSGALGFEALSRGAAFCLFVETDEQARGAIRENVDRLGLFGRTRVHRRDATALGQRPGADGPAFDLAFLDPPYGMGLAQTALERLREGAWLAPGALAVIETGVAEAALAVEGFHLLDSRDYGAARVSFMQLDAAG